MYYYDPAKRNAMAAQGGIQNKMAPTQNWWDDPEMAARVAASYDRQNQSEGQILQNSGIQKVPYGNSPEAPPSKIDQLKEAGKNMLVKEGVKQGGEFVGGQVAGGTPTPSGTDAAGNTTYSDGGVVSPKGDVIKEGSYAQSVRQYGGDAAAAYQFYKAMQAGTGREKALGTAGAANTAAQANGLYGAGAGAGIGAGIGAASALTSNMTDEQKAKALRRTGEDAAANYFTGGLFGLAQTGDRALLGGQSDKLRDKVDKYSLGAIVGDKVTTKALGMFGSSKSADQMQRDQVRAGLLKSGLLDNNYNIVNPDGSTFDIGKDGSELAKYSGVDPQAGFTGQAIGAANPLAYIVTGGNEKLAGNFAGYFTNAFMQGKGAAGMQGVNANAVDAYKKAGLTDPAMAHKALDELVKAGKLDAEKAKALHHGIDVTFGMAPADNAPKVAGAPRTGGGLRMGGKRRGGGRGQSTFTYTPQTPQTLTMPGSTPYSDNFAQNLANIYASNQGL